MEQQARLQMNLVAQDAEDGELAEDATSPLQVTLLQGANNTDMLDKNRAYLNSCSTVTAFKNSTLLSNIQKSDRPLRVNYNAGAVVANEADTFGHQEVYNIPEGIANIFSMPALEKNYRITYDS